MLTDGQRANGLPKRYFITNIGMRSNVTEAFTSTADVLMLLNPGYGWGQTQSFFKGTGMKKAELLFNNNLHNGIVHIVKNCFYDNPFLLFFCLL